MDDKRHPQFDEDFLQFESKVDQVLKYLDDMANLNKTDAEEGSKKAKIQPEIDEENFVISVRDDRTMLNKKAAKAEEGRSPAQLEKYTFMQQIEKDADERAKMRKERERLAQHFRTLGNEAYRKEKYEKAVIMFTKAIEHVKDSPILYNNRGLSYIQLKNYKRALMDVDYVLNNLEEKNLRSWLYRAASYKHLNDERNFENSITFARKNNPKHHRYINEFLEKLKLGLI